MRAAQKIINTHALRHNLHTLKGKAPQSQCIAVIKANAYGCEAAQLLPALAEADLLAVATIEEALSLHAVGAQKQILMLEGAFEESDVTRAYEHNFELAIGSAHQLQWLLDSAYTFSRVWLKLDTGMGRLGFQKHDADEAMKRLLSRYDEHTIVLMSHFSDADSQDVRKTHEQIKRFDEFASSYPLCQQSLCNSAGTLAFPEAHRDYIRPGIALYGVSPFIDSCGKDYGLQAVMSLKTRVMSVKKFKAEEPIGYGETFRLPSDGIIAVCEIGYADGYLRFIPSGTPVLINGREYPLAGRVSMDMITVLVDEAVQVGDEVLCWGDELAVEHISNAADTIPYQLLTIVTSRPKTVIIS